MHLGASEPLSVLPHVHFQNGGRVKNLLILQPNTLKCVSKILKQEMGNAVTESGSMFDRHCLVKQQSTHFPRACSAINPFQIFWCKLQNFGDVGRKNVCLLFSPAIFYLRLLKAPAGDERQEAGCFWRSLEQGNTGVSYAEVA